MNSNGYEYTPVTYVNTDNLYSLLNPLNEEVANRFGYHDPVASDVNDPNDGESDEFFSALGGPTGCGNVAFEYAYGAPAASEFSRVFAAIIPGAEQSVEGFFTTAESDRLVNEWASCIRDEGYSYDSPTDAASSFDSTPEPTEDEITVRRADIACDSKVGLTEQRSRYESNALSKWLDVNSLSVDELKTALDAALIEAIDRLDDLSREGEDVLTSVDSESNANTQESVPPTTVR